MVLLFFLSFLNLTSCHFSSQEEAMFNCYSQTLKAGDRFQLVSSALWCNCMLGQKS